METSFTVVAQSQTIDLSNGTPQNAMRVEFVSQPSGTRAYVTVPLSEYTAALVKRRIEEAVTNIEAVHALGS